MKLVKSLLLGSAAGIAAVAGAQAADLPSRKAAPVEYVRVCSAYGAGFFYIPGTDTCLRVGGRVRAEYTIGTRYGDNQDAYGTRARGRLNIDARTATAYGTLRTFIRYEITNSSGMYLNSTPSANQGITFAGNFHSRASATSTVLDLAFVQFGPITAGRAQSFFDFYANDFGFSVLKTADSRLNLLAYTATFGSGFSATVSLEDRTSGTGNRENDFQGFDALGQDFPDIVASLRVDQGWGSAQLSGALSQRNAGFIDPVTGIITNSQDEWGWAIQGGLKINLPMLAAGDHLFLQAAYADGALGYLGWGGDAGLGRTGRLPISDFGVNPLTGQSDSSTGWSVVAGLRHFWTPQLRSEIFGSYSELKLGNRVALVGGGFGTLDPKELIVAGNLIWSPVAGLDIGVEVLYTNIDLKHSVQAVNNVGLRNTGRWISSEDAWAGRFRIQRDF